MKMSFKNPLSFRFANQHCACISHPTHLFCMCLPPITSCFT
jgi:hypothetical protein